MLSDSADLGWHDLCNDPAGTGNTNCNPNPPNVGAASQSIDHPAAVDDGHDDPQRGARRRDRRSPAGSTVHDFVTVSGGAGNPVPTGTVTIDWFTNNTCTGAPADDLGAARARRTARSTRPRFPQGPLAAGLYGFKAHYLGDPANPVYTPSDGAVRAAARRRREHPDHAATATNRVGQTHTFTAHVNVNDGTRLRERAGRHARSPSRSTAAPARSPRRTRAPRSARTGSCTIDAHLGDDRRHDRRQRAHRRDRRRRRRCTRDTNGVGAQLRPGDEDVGQREDLDRAERDERGRPAAHVHGHAAEGHRHGHASSPAAGEHVDVTLTDSNGADAHARRPAPARRRREHRTRAASARSPSPRRPPGKVTGHATSTLSVGGSAPFTVATDGAAPNSGDAVKTFVDANIQITPPTATNPVGTTHVFTAHVNVNTGNGAAS